MVISFIFYIFCVICFILGIILGFVFATTKFKKTLQDFTSPSLVKSNTSNKSVVSNIGDKMVNFVVKNDDKSDDKEPKARPWGATI